MGLKQLETLAEFEALLKEAGNKLVMVDFYADWCGPCRMIAPTIEKMATEFPNVCFVKVNVDNNSETSEKYEVSAMPTFKFFKGGKMVAEVVGASEPKIRKEIVDHQ